MINQKVIDDYLCYFIENVDSQTVLYGRGYSNTFSLLFTLAIT